MIHSLHLCETMKQPRHRYDAHLFREHTSAPNQVAHERLPDLLPCGTIQPLRCRSVVPLVHTYTLSPLTFAKEHPPARRLCESTWRPRYRSGAHPVPDNTSCLKYSALLHPLGSHARVRKQDGELYYPFLAVPIRDVTRQPPCPSVPSSCAFALLNMPSAAVAPSPVSEHPHRLAEQPVASEHRPGLHPL